MHKCAILVKMYLGMGERLIRCGKAGLGVGMCLKGLVLRWFIWVLKGF